MAGLDERKLRLYKFLVKVGRTQIEDVPSPYREALQEEE